VLVFVVMPVVVHVSDLIPEHALVVLQSLTQDGQHLDHTVLALSDVVLESKLANVLALLVTHVEHHALDQTLEHELVAPPSLIQDGQHLDHTELALSDVELEFKLANVLVLLATHVEHHALDQTLDQELADPLSFTLNGQHSDHMVLAQLDVVLEFRSANVLALLETLAVTHV